MLKKTKLSTVVIAAIFAMGCFGPGSLFDTTSPAEVSALLAALGLGKVTLSWTNPTDEDLDHVEVWYREGTGTDTQFTGTISAVGTIIDGLTAGIEYTFTLKTVDTAENVSTGVSVTVTAIDLIGGMLRGGTLNLTNVVTTIAGTVGTTGSTDGTGTAAKFYGNHHIISDGTSIFVADTYNHTIRKIDIASAAVTTLAGSAGTSGSTDGTGTAARFFDPVGVTTDGTNLFVADTGNHTIRKLVIATGVVTTLAGTAGTSGSTDGTGTAAKFSDPIGITTDGTYLYVTETGNHTIRKVEIATGVVSTVAGTAGTSGSADGTGTAATFYTPYGISTDGTNLYVADSYNCTIRKIVIATGVVTTIAGTAGTTGSADGTGTSATFNVPFGMAADAENLYIVDAYNHTVRKLVKATGVVSTIVGTAGTYGSADGSGTTATFNTPTGIATDGSVLYISDFQNSIIRKIE